MSDEAVFSHLLPEIERLVTERVRVGRIDETGNVTIGTADLLRYGLDSCVPMPPSDCRDGGRDLIGPSKCVSRA